MTPEQIDAEYSRRLTWMKARNFIDINLLDPMHPMPRDYYRAADSKDLQADYDEERQNGWAL